MEADKLQTEVYSTIMSFNVLFNVFIIVCLKKNCFIALIHPVQWTIANPVHTYWPAKQQKKSSCVSSSWPVLILPEEKGKT